MESLSSPAGIFRNFSIGKRVSCLMAPKIEYTLKVLCWHIRSSSMRDNGKCPECTRTKKVTISKYRISLSGLMHNPHFPLVCGIVLDRETCILATQTPGYVA